MKSFLSLLIVSILIFSISCSKSGGNTLPVITPPRDTLVTTPPTDTTVTTPPTDTTVTPPTDKPDTTLGTIRAADEFVLYTNKTRGFGEIDMGQVGGFDHVYNNTTDGAVKWEFVPADANDVATVTKDNQTDFKINYHHSYTGNNTTMSADTVGKYDCIISWTTDNKKDVIEDIYFVRTHTAKSPLQYSVRDLKDNEASLVTPRSFNDDVKYFAYKMTK